MDDNKQITEKCYDKICHGVKSLCDYCCNYYEGYDPANCESCIVTRLLEDATMKALDSGVLDDN